MGGGGADQNRLKAFPFGVRLVPYQSLICLCVMWFKQNLKQASVVSFKKKKPKQQQTISCITMSG